MPNQAKVVPFAPCAVKSFVPRPRKALNGEGREGFAKGAKTGALACPAAAICAAAPYLYLICTYTRFLEYLAA
jgi:hypothetical protein